MENYPEICLALNIIFIPYRHRSYIYLFQINTVGFTFDTSEVVVDILMKPGSVHLLAVEVL